MTLTEANLQAQATWNNKACGSRSSDEQAPEYAEMRRRRYEEDDPWVPSALDFPSMNGKHVLEIGHGMGCDLATAALSGAITHGIDLTPNHHEIAKRTFDVLGLPRDLHLGNAGQLPFSDHSMDVVYSLGVLHHTDNTEQCIAEAHRVLKPGGTFVVALYHFWSLPHLSLVGRGCLTGKLFRLGYHNLLSTIEAGADGITIKPLVKLNTRRSVRRLLSDFSHTDVSIHGLAYSKLRAIGPMLSPAVGKALERRWGWYVVAHATKK